MQTTRWWKRSIVSWPNFSMILEQTVDFPDAVPPATPIKNGVRGGVILFEGEPFDTDPNLVLESSSGLEVECPLPGFTVDCDPVDDRSNGFFGLMDWSLGNCDPVTLHWARSDVCPKSSFLDVEFFVTSERRFVSVPLVVMVGDGELVVLIEY